MTFGGNFNLPSVYFNIFFDERADKYPRVTISLLLELNGQIEIIVIIAGYQVTVFLVRTTFANQQAVFHIP